RRSGIRAGRLGADAKTRSVAPADRPAACRARVNAHHRRAQADTGDFGDERALVFAGPVRDIGRRTAHVETDDAIEAGEPRYLDRPHDTAGGTGQDRVFALKEMRVGQATRALHELQ